MRADLHELIKEAMRVVLDRAHHPLLVVSASGTHQVGALVGCLRRLQRWTLAATLAEYRLYAAPSPRLAVEQFIELWDCDLLTLPADVPSWFARQLEMLEDDRELLARMVAEEGASSLSGSYQGAARSSVGGGSLSRGASNLASPLQAPAASVSAPAPLPLPAAISDGVLPDASPSPPTLQWHWSRRTKLRSRPSPAPPTMAMPPPQRSILTSRDCWRLPGPKPRSSTRATTEARA